MKQVYLFSFFVFLCLPLFGQGDTYIVVSNTDIYKIEADYSLTYLFTHECFSTDIALSPTNTMYGISIEGQIYEIDTQTGMCTQLTALPFDDIDFSPIYTSLVCGNSDELFSLAGDGKLYKYNIGQDSVELMDDIGAWTPGDLTFYKGNLIFQNGATQHIEAYNIENGMLSTVICKFSSLPNQVYGISNLFNTCDSEQILATDKENNLFEFNIEDGNIEFITNYEQFDIPNEVIEIYGMTSSSEHQASACESFTFTDIDCTNVGVDETIFESIKIYPNPANNIVFIEGIEKIDYVDVFSIDGKKINRIYSETNQFDISNLLTGLYLFKFYLNNNYFTKKILVEK